MNKRKKLPDRFSHTTAEWGAILQSHSVKQPITSNIRKPCRGQPSHATQAGQLLYEEEDLQQGRHPCDSFTSVLAAKVPKGARNPSRAHRKPSNTK
jgi:hypothetical protein